MIYETTSSSSVACGILPLIFAYYYMDMNSVSWLQILIEKPGFWVHSNLFNISEIYWKVFWNFYIDIHFKESMYIIILRKNITIINLFATIMLPQHVEFNTILLKKDTHSKDRQPAILSFRKFWIINCSILPSNCFMLIMLWYLLLKWVNI